jgi:hypothetical protein
MQENSSTRFEIDGTTNMSLPQEKSERQRTRNAFIAKDFGNVPSPRCLQ